MKSNNLKTTEKQISASLKKEIKNLANLGFIDINKLFTKRFFNVLGLNGKDSYEWDKNLDKELSNLSIIGHAEDKSYEAVHSGYGSGPGRMVHHANYSVRVVGTLNDVLLINGLKVLPDFNKIISLWKNKFKDEQDFKNYDDVVKTPLSKFNKINSLSIFSGTVSNPNNLYLEVILSNIKKEGFIPKYKGDISVYAVNNLGHGSQFISQEDINHPKKSKSLRTTKMLSSDPNITKKFRNATIFTLNGLKRIVNESLGEFSGYDPNEKREVLTVYNA